MLIVVSFSAFLDNDLLTCDCIESEEDPVDKTGPVPPAVNPVFLLRARSQIEGFSASKSSDAVLLQRLDDLATERELAESRVSVTMGTIDNFMEESERIRHELSRRGISAAKDNVKGKETSTKPARVVERGRSPVKRRQEVVTQAGSDAEMQSSSGEEADEVD